MSLTFSSYLPVYVYTCMTGQENNIAESKTDK